MTDLEMTRLCAEAMGLRWKEHAGVIFDLLGEYRPLHDDAQAMALDSVLIDSAHSISFHASWFARHEYPSGLHTFEFHADMTKPENRRRARVECVAKLQQAKG